MKGWRERGQPKKRWMDYVRREMAVCDEMSDRGD
jgi:hypothetical protein